MAAAAAAGFKERMGVVVREVDVAIKWRRDILWGWGDYLSLMAVPSL